MGDLAVKDLELTLRVRNNQLKQRRDGLGLSQKGLAAAAGVSFNEYAELERMRASPLGRDGEWGKCARKLAIFYEVEPRELFPPAVQAVEDPVAVRRVDAWELQPLLSSHQQRAIEAPDVLHDQDELRENLERACASLTMRECEVLRRRFGAGSGGEETLEEIAESYGVNRERIRQIQAKAICKLRNRDDGTLRLFYDPEATDPREEERDRQESRELEWVKIANDVHAVIDEMQQEKEGGPGQPSLTDRLRARGYDYEQAISAVVGSLDRHRHHWRKLSYRRVRVSKGTARAVVVSVVDSRELWWSHSFVVPQRHQRGGSFNMLWERAS